MSCKSYLSEHQSNLTAEVTNVFRTQGSGQAHCVGVSKTSGLYELWLHGIWSNSSGAGSSRRPNVVLINEGHPANDLFLMKFGNARFYRVTTAGEDITLLWGASLASLRLRHHHLSSQRRGRSPCNSWFGIVR